MKTIVLVGGGHAHLYCLEQLEKDFPENLRVVLISPSPHQYYSGMFSGFTEGIYSRDDVRIDLNRLSLAAGATFSLDTIVAVDPYAKNLTGASGEVYTYDFVSFDIGSLTEVPEMASDHVSSIKPNYRFADQLLHIRKTTHPVIVGGGASGVELAFSIQAWRKEHGLPLNTVLFSSSSLLSAQGQKASRKIEAIAKQKALAIFTGVTVDSIDSETLTDSNDESHPQTAVLWLTGPKSAELFRVSRLPTDDGGFLLVNEELQSVQHPAIFGAGDCISIDRYPALAKNGVYAVRQGPILWENLKMSLSNGELKAFAPQKRFVAILSTGDGQAFLSYGEPSLHGRAAWKIKQRIDRKFMKRFKKLYE